jgi:hypothetical protein
VFWTTWVDLIIATMTDWVMETIMDIAKAGGWLTGRPTSSGPPKVEWALIRAHRANPGNARAHSNKQRRRIAAGLREFSFLNPVPVDT